MPTNPFLRIKDVFARSVKRWALDFRTFLEHRMTRLNTTLASLLRAPLTGECLSPLEPWLLATDDALFPIFCKTPILQPDIDVFLKGELWSISRAFAEFEESTEPRQWYFSRYGGLNAPDPAPIDAFVRGEGYPGFWNTVDKPDYLKDLLWEQPEETVVDALSGRHYRLGLDLGCGQGGMTQRMSEHCRQVIGLESNFYLAATANHLLTEDEIAVRYFAPETGLQTRMLRKTAVSNATVICGDVRALPFCEPIFDWVHCGHFLDLMDDPGDIVSAVKHILKPGAVLSICSPWDFVEKGHFDELIDILQHDFKEILQRDGSPWLRYHHKRRQILHEDWIWIGKLG